MKAQISEVVLDGTRRNLQIEERVVAQGHPSLPAQPKGWPELQTQESVADRNLVKWKEHVVCFLTLWKYHSKLQLQQASNLIILFSTTYEHFSPVLNLAAF